MIYLILDVFYHESEGLSSAVVSGIIFSGVEQHNILSEHTIRVDNVAPYESGQFYKRELPCLLALIEQIDQPFDVIVIDGYVYLDGQSKAGLGKYLYNALDQHIPIIGIAKNYYHEISDDYAVKRGMSKHPLYVTCVGTELDTAKMIVKNLNGKHRLPAIVTRVDQLGRGLRSRLFVSE